MSVEVQTKVDAVDLSYFYGVIYLFIVRVYLLRATSRSVLALPVIRSAI